MALLKEKRYIFYIQISHAPQIVPTPGCRVQKSNQSCFFLDISHPLNILTDLMYKLLHGR